MQRYNYWMKKILLIAVLLTCIGAGCGHTQPAPAVQSPEPTTQAPPIQGQSGCKSNSDCQNGATCMVEGPLIANQPVRRVCVPRGQAVPL